MTDADKTRVQLIGDSITVGYAPAVADQFGDAVDILPPPENAGDTANLRDHLDEWVLGNPPDLLVINCGLHDLKRLRPEGRFQQPLDAYRRNLAEIFTRLNTALPGRVIWSTITPVIDERHQARKEFDRREADVQRYNAAARALAEHAGIPVLDLHDVIMTVSPQMCIGADGVHMTIRGNDVLANAVTARIEEALRSV